MCMEKYYHQIQFITFFSDPLILYNLKKKKDLIWSLKMYVIQSEEHNNQLSK